MASLNTTIHVATEWSLQAKKPRKNPWGEISVSAVMTGPDGTQKKFPLFWVGGDEWKLRVSVSRPGIYTLRTECSDQADTGLQGREAILVAEGIRQESNPLFLHGPVGVKKGKGFFHEDGTPFFWFGDTWWMQMSDRVRWPQDFSTLAGDRAARGFTVAQVVLGFPGDLATDDPRTANEGGLPWEKDLGRINPRYFDACDLRLQTIIRAGILPCILGSWGYHLLTLGEERMTSHWRYLVARYGAWPVAWSLAGETAMSYYLSKDPAGDTEKLRAAWSRVSKAIRSFDPYERPLSAHPRRTSWDDLEDSSALDYLMLQPGHMRNALGIGVACIADARARFPNKPVVNAEPPYEGHMGTNGPDVQRFAFWSSILSGAAGFTYGAAGIFQANDRDRPTGNRPDGGAFDAATWDEAIRFPGAPQLGRARALLMELPWDRFEPHPEWASTSVRWGAESYDPPLRVYSAGIPSECRVHYIPRRYWHWDGAVIHGIEKGIRYRAEYVDPERFARFDLGLVESDAHGDWKAPTTPYLMEWVLVLRRSADA
jgi:hypothetical protein